MTPGKESPETAHDSARDAHFTRAGKPYHITITTSFSAEPSSQPSINFVHFIRPTRSVPTISGSSTTDRSQLTSILRLFSVNSATSIGLLIPTAEDDRRRTEAIDESPVKDCRKTRIRGGSSNLEVGYDRPITFGTVL